MSDIPQVDEQTKALEEKIRDGLRQVVDPEIGMDIITLGLVRHIEVSEERVHLVMILTTPFCPYGPQLMEQARRTAGEVSGRRSTIEMGLEMWDPSMMEEGAADDWGLF
jgi:metal-sulfur cluster biosynthetic enzyme